MKIFNFLISIVASVISYYIANGLTKIMEMTNYKEKKPI